MRRSFNSCLGFFGYRWAFRFTLLLQIMSALMLISFQASVIKKFGRQGWVFLFCLEVEFGPAERILQGWANMKIATTSTHITYINNTPHRMAWRRRVNP